MTELECVSSQANAVHTHKTELNQTIQELEETLKVKEEVICYFLRICNLIKYVCSIGVYIRFKGIFCHKVVECFRMKFF